MPSRMPFAAAVFAAALGAIQLAGAAPALSQEAGMKERPFPVIRVTGEGRASAVPDLAIVTLGMLRQAPTAREALDAHKKVADELGEALRGLGIKPEDLQTANFAIQPQYVYPQPKANGEQDPPRIVGYQVSSQLVVRIRDVSAIGKILDQAVSLGVNSDGAIQFTNDDPSPILARARAAAMKDAVARATTLAEAAGVELGPILEINEQFQQPQPIPLAKGRMMMDAAASPAEVPVEAGENAYSVNVSAVFEIGQAK